MAETLKDAQKAVATDTALDTTVADTSLRTRLQTMIGPQASANLERICQSGGWTKREAIERAINELAKMLQCNESGRPNLCQTLDSDSPATMSGN